MEANARQVELTNLLDKAARAYEQENREIMSNFEYDRLYDELKQLEEKSGIVLANSPTVHAGYEVLSQLPKYKHETPCLSLDKTKEPAALAEWLKGQEGILSWKMDGLTVVLTYQNGELLRAVTRGNGEEGEVITNNARVFKNVPLKIPYKGELVVRGEAVIKYSDFEIINASIENPDEQYKNPRNLCSGSVRQLNNEITAKRNVHFIAFSLFSASVDGDYIKDEFRFKEEGYCFLEKQGFTVVERKMVNSGNIVETINWFEKKIAENDFPSDGLVLTLNDIAYGRSLGRTSKFPRDSIAFKWQDETTETTLREIEWSASRTGLINPVAIFDSVELEGTTVSRASVHNVSVMEELKLGIGDRITVFKANMIIPQIADNLTGSGNVNIPEECPVCGGKTAIKNANGIRSLYCTNPECSAKKIKSFSHFVSRDAMNIDGLSEATLEKFISKGFIHEFADLFTLSQHKDAIITMEGFGEKSYKNLLESINKASSVNISNFIYALGIPNIGLSNARLICKHYGQDFNAVRNADKLNLGNISGIGDVIADSFVEYMNKPENIRIIDNCLKYIYFTENEQTVSSPITDKIFVITGSVNSFSNRNELKSFIEQRGGKVASAVSGNTDYLINNDVNSSSGKNKKARELGISIISEEEFLKMVNQ
ncbi:MAG: NAD-dependent DNA ligase LigA [Lachnospiraceae bacterium]